MRTVKIDRYAKKAYTAVMNTTHWIQQHTKQLTGKTVAITGSTGGIGTALCRHLAFLGASLVLLDRNSDKSRSLRDALLKDYPCVQITLIPLELESTATVKAACDALKALPIDILIHNAGAYSIPRKTTDAGFDNVFQIDCAAPYFMTRELLGHLRKRHAKVVIVGSIAHAYSKSDPDDIDFSSRKSAALVYGNAKRRLMFSMYALFDGETEASLAVCHPGISFTNITAHYPKWLFALIRRPMKLIFMKPDKAALSILRGCFESCRYPEWIGPRQFHIWGLPAKRILHTCSSKEAAQIAADADRIYQRIKETAL